LKFNCREKWFLGGTNVVSKTFKRKGEPIGVEPHSWDFDSWPGSVWPNDPIRAKWVVRSNRRELVAEGALTRVGKRVVILGKGYSRFLARRADRLGQFESNLPHLRRSDVA
jgi:hypothetical protein